MIRNKKKIFSFNSELHKVTGIQKVLMDIHHAVSDYYNAQIVGTIPYHSIHKSLKIGKNEYIRFVNPFMFYNSIVFLHERKFLILFWLLNNIFFQKIKIIYIHHNIFKSYRLLSVMPKTVVAISNEGVLNLSTYFKVPANNIYKIYNCVKDNYISHHKVPTKEHINIIYPARINDVKRQIEIVDKLNGKLDRDIKIYFVGEGPLLELLQEKVKDNNQFVVLGFRADILDLFKKMDYVMLFSKQEGLPITLIEATMMGLPILCNNVGGNSEIVSNNKNGFIFEKDDWDMLINKINTLKEISDDYYIQMSNESRNIYLQNFTFNKFKQKYLELLEMQKMSL